jgi:hypothetical protein
MPGFDTAREHWVEAFFESHLGAFMAVEVIQKEHWGPDLDLPHSAIGISVPDLEMSLASNVLYVQICPAMIVDQADLLDETEFTAYVTYLLVHVMLHQVFHWIEPDDEQERSVESTLHEVLPEHYQTIANYVKDNK